MADVQVEDFPFLDDPEAEMSAIRDEYHATAVNFGRIAQIHYNDREWAEARTAALIAAAYNGMVLNLIAGNSGD